MHRSVATIASGDCLLAGCLQPISGKGIGQAQNGLRFPQAVPYREVEQRLDQLRGRWPNRRRGLVTGCRRGAQICLCGRRIMLQACDAAMRCPQMSGNQGRAGVDFHGVTPQPHL